MEEQTIEEFAQQLINGDEHQSWQYVQNLIDEKKDSIYIFDEFLAETMRFIGQLWEENIITVADEHIASNVCKFLISKYNVTMDTVASSQLKADRPKIMLFCVEGEEHTLGIKMAETIFKENGWQTRLVGASLPMPNAIIHANKWRPDAIAISVTIIYNIPKLVNYVKAIENLSFKPKILIGGRLATMYPLNDYCSDTTIIFNDLDGLKNWLAKNTVAQGSYVSS